MKILEAFCTLPVIPEIGIFYYELDGDHSKKSDQETIETAKTGKKQLGLSHEGN